MTMKFVGVQSTEFEIYAYSPKLQPVAELAAEFCSAEYQLKNIWLAECSFTQSSENLQQKIAKLIKSAANNLTTVAYIFVFFEVCYITIIVDCLPPKTMSFVVTDQRDQPYFSHNFCNLKINQTNFCHST